jgi:hypothetical protein
MTDFREEHFRERKELRIGGNPSLVDLIMERNKFDRI